MKRSSVVVIITFLLVLLVVAQGVSSAASTGVSLALSSVISLPTMTAYCQAPPLKADISPNIMLTIDVSGSMAWPAYYPSGYSNAQIDAAYDATVEYEGYFDPSKTYVPDAGGIYTETTSTAAPCVRTTCQTWSCQKNDNGTCEQQGTHGCSTSRYACCSLWNTTGTCNLFSGNYLNFKLMHRVDLIRWAMTGGRPASCTASQAGNGGYCEPEAWADSGNASKVGSVCNNSLDVDGNGIADGGCILLTDGGDQVKVRWERITGINYVNPNTGAVGTLSTAITGTSYGLAFRFSKSSPRPRMGAMFFSGSGVRASKVYLGDFTGPNSLTPYPFYNMITQVNSQDPSGSTPTGPAMWDTYNYFAMKPPQYGGFPAQSGTGDRWKNPMYQCDSTGSSCTLVPCADAFVILMSDGQWNQPGCSIDSVDANGNSADPVVPAYQMHGNFLNSAMSLTTKVRGVYTLGLFMGGSGQLAMENIAMYGSFDQSSNVWPGSLTGYPQATCTATDCGSSKGSSCTALPPSSPDWDTDGDGIPDTFYSGNNATEIRDAILNAIMDILTHTSAGTAASVLASRENSGANLLQAVYYPKKPYGASTITWVGNLQNLWYYIDPSFTNSNIREDGRDSAGNHDLIMNLITSGVTQKDYITAFRFDRGLQAAVADRWTDNNGDGSILGETQFAPIKVDTVANLWEAGQLLWNRTWSSRNVYAANVDTAPTSNNLMSFSCLGTNCPNAPVLAPYLNAIDLTTGALSNDVATTIMQWTLGTDYPLSGTLAPNYRKRRAKIGSVTQTWKLGDIINSTPKISTWQPLGDYHLTYAQYESTYGPSGTSVYQSDPVNSKYYITTSRYKGRGMVYAGANDGMLHAFRLGLLTSKWSGQGTYEKAKLSNKVCSVSNGIYCNDDTQCPSGETCSSSVTLGDEAWAFIPKQALPYLKYMADPSYCHIYTIDLTPMVFDASIAVPSTCASGPYYDCIKKVDSWRTILIGGMRLGGACRNPGETCTNCVNTPIQDPGNAAKGLGYSSYFALDITDQNSPKLMWEYDGTVKNSDGTYSNSLGFSYSGPAVVRISNVYVGGILGSAQRNGKWFVVFGSGPTGPVDAANTQFLGKSDQNLKLHIFDLAIGPGTDNGNVYVFDTGVANAFSGSVTTTSYDVNLDYSDDVIYVPYVNAGPDGLFASGGLGRLVLKGLDPSQWKWSIVLGTVGPITEAPDMLKDPQTGDIWLYFGTGRYFFDSIAGVDDPNPVKQRQLIGMKEYCLNSAKTGFVIPCPATKYFCATPVGAGTCGPLTNVDNISVANMLESTNASSMDPNYLGWYIDLDPPVDSSGNPNSSNPTLWGERVITNPSVDATGIVFFTSFKPQNDPCYKGGQTNIWAVKFDTGGSATGLMHGNAIIQVSTGSIEQIDLSSAFTKRDNRRTEGMVGQPPTREGLTVIPGTPGASRPLFMKER